MKLIIRYFPPYSDVTGTDSEEIEMRGSSVEVVELLGYLIDKHPGLKPYVSMESDEAFRRHMVIAIDSEVVRLTDTIDITTVGVVKILPPVFGGNSSA